MANPVPTLSIPVSGSPPKAVITLANFKGPLRLTIPDSAKLPAEGSVYAILLDPEGSELTGGAIPVGEWVSPQQSAEPDEGEYRQNQNLKVELYLERLQEFKGKTVQLGYQGMGESGLPVDSDAISLQII